MHLVLNKIQDFIRKLREGSLSSLIRCISMHLVLNKIQDFIRSFSTRPLLRCHSISIEFFLGQAFTFLVVQLLVFLHSFATEKSTLIFLEVNVKQYLFKVIFMECRCLLMESLCFVWS